MKRILKNKALVLFLALCSCAVSSVCVRAEVQEEDSSEASSVRVKAAVKDKNGMEDVRKFGPNELEMKNYDITSIYYDNSCSLRCIHKKTKAVIWVTLEYSGENSKKKPTYLGDNSFAYLTFKTLKDSTSRVAEKLIAECAKRDINRIKRENTPSDESILDAPDWTELCYMMCDSNGEVNVGFDGSKRSKGGFSADKDLSVEFLNYLRSPRFLRNDEVAKDIFESAKESTREYIESGQFWVNAGESMYFDKRFKEQQSEMLKKLDSISIEDLKEFYKEYVNPSNLIFELRIGELDVSFDKVKEYLNVLDKQYLSKYDYVKPKEFVDKENKIDFGTYKEVRKPASFWGFVKDSKDGKERSEKKGYYDYSNEIKINLQGSSFHDLQFFDWFATSFLFNEDTKKGLEKDFGIYKVYSYLPGRKWDPEKRDYVCSFTIDFSGKGENKLSKDLSKSSKFINELSKYVLSKCSERINKMSDSELKDLYESFVNGGRFMYYHSVGSSFKDLPVDRDISSFDSFLNAKDGRIPSLKDIYTQEKFVDSLKNISKNFRDLDEKDFELTSYVKDENLKNYGEFKYVQRYWRLPIHVKETDNSLVGYFANKMLGMCIEGELIDKAFIRANVSSYFNKKDVAGFETVCFVTDTEARAREIFEKAKDLKGKLKVGKKSFKKYKDKLSKKFKKSLELSKDGVNIFDEYLKKLENIKDGDSFKSFTDDLREVYDEKKLYKVFFLEEFSSEVKRLSEAMNQPTRDYNKLVFSSETTKELADRFKMNSEARKIIRNYIEARKKFFEAASKIDVKIVDGLESLTLENLREMIGNYEFGSFDEINKENLDSSVGG